MNLLQCFSTSTEVRTLLCLCPELAFSCIFREWWRDEPCRKRKYTWYRPAPTRSLLHTFTWIRGWYTQTKDSVNAFFTGSNRNEWFALYRDDGLINDETFVKGVRRGEFRLHPIGPSGISKGCITLYSQSDFKILASALLRTGGQQLGNYIIAHGVVQVY